MLIADISINRKDYIDKIFIQRVGGVPPGVCKYTIQKPENYSDKVFTHKHSDGYLPLLCRCLNYIKREQKRLNEKYNTSKI